MMLKQKVNDFQKSLPHQPQLTVHTYHQFLFVHQLLRHAPLDSSCRVCVLWEWGGGGGGGGG